MNVVFAGVAWEDLQYWIKHDKSGLKKVLRLIEDCRRSPLRSLT